ncbi:amidase [Belnapia rosea]|uniref:Aspartyl-tRNA(Asn)/glutamyl-tRNA(Gln) amidotransferase subunit A n=1 Tax=Belnapia rosea TaxID=938405 RepID=A0A1G6J2J1_9PROT|nr:amidase [Belnapia rosea]SDC12813.1 aspartyl-tRNA(Asn)/glutamyl-tRNA(Gln) amidotransferase subunit A [Belnapia rosea]
MSAPHALPLAEAAALIAARRLSPVELLQSCLDRIAAVEPRLNAIIRLVAEEAMADARAAEAEIARGGPRSPMHGIPVGLKDIIDLAGHPTTCHSKLQIDRVAAGDSHATARLRAAGAIFPAKLATHEFAIGGPAFDLPFPPARNPWNTAHHPGGSSSGSGTAVAARMLPAALGTDTGGSVRHPASHCGLVGLKPTYGLVSRRGVFPLSFTLDHVGPMTRTVRDNALLLNAIAGYDPADPGSAARPAEDYTRDLHLGLRGLRIGFVRHFHEHDQPATPEMGAALEAAASLLAAEGAKVTTVILPPLGEFAGVNRTIMLPEATAIHEAWLRERPGDYAHITRRRLLPGMFVTGADYVQAQRRRRELVGAVEAAFAEVDLLLCASSMDPACRIDDAAEVERTYPRQARTPFNVTGHPAISVMCGISREAGLPLGMQLVAPGFQEALLYRAAAAYERAAPWREMAPPI